MKWVVTVLLLLNILMLAYFNLSQSPKNAHVSLQPLHPEKIKLLTQKEVEALPGSNQSEAVAAQEPKVDMTPVVYSCYEWGNFSADNLPKARNILTKFSVESTVRQEVGKESVRYWVYIPRLSSLQAAQTKMEELRALGVTESLIMQDTQWKNAISLGVFKDEQLANKLLEELKNRGVRSAVKGVRNGESSRASLLIQHVSPEIASEIEKLKPDFAGSELKPVTCQ